MFNDLPFRIFGIPLVAIGIALIFQANEPAFVWENLFRRVLVSFTFTLLLWEGNRLLWIQLRRQFPGFAQTRKRIIRQALGSVLFTVAITYIVIIAYRLINIEVCQPGMELNQAAFNLIPTFFASTVYESVYFFKAWKANIQHAEQLAHENIKSQFKALKNQLDPHFLFNSLNTLSALIEEENTPAQDYLERLSDVYRYVLLSRDRDTVSVDEELKFVEAYVYLNKVRFRNSLRFENLLPEVYLDQKIAPLSIQMLVENAIKHNEASKQKPLTVRLCANDQHYITVENNLQRKRLLKEKSTHTGLANIVKRYELLSSKPVQVVNDAQWFRVMLPVLA